MLNIDIDELRDIAKQNEASIAKVKIQAYCKERGFKLSKSNTSVKAMIGKVIDHLDEVANGSGASYTDSIVPTSFDDELINSSSTVNDNTNLQSLEQTQNHQDNQETGVLEMPINDLNDLEVVLELQQLQDIEEISVSDDILVSTLSTYKPNSLLDIIGEKYTPYQSLIGRGNDAYINVPYWVTDWIININGDWKYKLSDFPEKQDIKYLNDMIYYINLNGKVIVRESRNSGFHHFY